MDYPIHIDTISMELSILYFKGLSVKISKNYAFLSLKIVFILANSADHDEMPHKSGSTLFAKVAVYQYPE